MAEIHVLIVPSLRKSHEKAAAVMRSSHYDKVFLNLPRSLQSLISKMVLGRMDFEEFLERMKIFLPEPKGAWIYLLEPILRALNEVKSEVYCYLEDFEEIAKNSVEIAVLTLKATITGRICVDEWLKVLKPLPSSSSIEFIAYRAEGKCLCISNLSGWNIARRIRNYGHEVFLKCVESFYRLKPLETLAILLEIGKATPEIAERLIKEHVKFINEYVLRSRDLDEAYSLWASSRFFENEPQSC